MAVSALYTAKHPSYTFNSRNWMKWRLSYEGGDRFIARYLQKFSKRESDAEFNERKNITYAPSFAKAAIKEIRNSIFRRLADVVRAGGSDSYQLACSGLNGGVDLYGNSMNSFMGRIVLEELLPMQRIGIYVDMPQIDGTSKAAAKGKRPYLSWYRTEDIQSWTFHPTQPNEFSEILLCDTILDTDRDSTLPQTEGSRYRRVWLDDDGFVNIQYCDQDGIEEEPIVLKIRKIPFVMVELPESLMTDICGYQIALLNMASSDVIHAVKANFSLYVEQYDNRTDTPNLKTQAPAELFGTSTNTASATPSTPTVAMGPTTGRRYPMNANQPAFINPSSEPLEASMKKQQQMKQEIRELVNLAVASLTSDDSTVMAGEESVESGLTAIALELELAERKIAEFWAIYEGKDTATVNYPEHYAVVSDEQRLESADAIIGMIPKLPSLAYQKAMAKRAIRKVFQNKEAAETLQKMFAEIDSAEIVSIDPEVLSLDIKNGLVDLETASKARGYPADCVEKAKKEHVERLAQIAISQATAAGAGAGAKVAEGGQARGVSDTGANENAGKQEKANSQNTDKDPVGTDKQRGEGK